MANVFDGKAFAKEREKIIREKVSKLKVKPKLVSILVGNDKASLLYTNLKKQAGTRVGIKFEVKKFQDTIPLEKLVAEINKLNKDKKTDGIMIQLPLPSSLSKKTKDVLKIIDKNKDVDGLVGNSPFTPAAVKAIRIIIEYAVKDLPYFGKKAAVVGAKGNVGKKTVEMLQKIGYKVTECDKDTRDLYAKLSGVDLIVSATGIPNLIKSEMVKEGFIAIDVGSPEADFDKKVSDKASFVTPVPGGVGPVTISCLLENLVDKL